jgi:hypothetical protein
MTGDEVRSFALSLPGAVEKETWGHPTFRVRDKLFASMGPDGRSGTVKSTLPEQKALIQSRPDVFSVPDYVGRYGWVGVRFDRVDPDELRELIVDGWRMTAPKRLVAAYDAAHPAPDR